MPVILICLFLTLCLPANVSGKAEKEVFRVMCYNVENYFDCVDDSLTKDEEYLPGGVRGWNYNRYVQKQHNIARVIVAVGGWEPPALVGLSEVESRKAILDLVRGPLKNLQYRFVHYESPDIRGVDVALLYQPGVFKPVRHEPLRVTFPDAPNSTTRDILYVSGALPTGDTLHVFVCHFPSRLGGELESAGRRNAAARVLRAKVDELFNQRVDAKVLIMGDFNDYPDNESMLQVLKAGYPGDSFLSAELYNLMFPLHRAGRGTHKHEAEWGALDQIIVSSNLLDNRQAFFTSVADLHIFNADFLLEDDFKYLGKKPYRTYIGMKYNGGFSDHLPLYVDFYY